MDLLLLIWCHVAEFARTNPLLTTWTGILKVYYQFIKLICVFKHLNVTNIEVKKMQITWHPSFPFEKAHIMVGFKCSFKLEFMHSSSDKSRKLAFNSTFDDDASTPTRPHPTIVPDKPVKSCSKIFRKCSYAKSNWLFNNLWEIDTIEYMHSEYVFVKL